MSKKKKKKDTEDKYTLAYVIKIKACPSLMWTTLECLKPKINGDERQGEGIIQKPTHSLIC